MPPKVRGGFPRQVDVLLPDRPRCLSGNLLLVSRAFRAAAE